MIKDEKDYCNEFNQVAEFTQIPESIQYNSPIKKKKVSTKRLTTLIFIVFALLAAFKVIKVPSFIDNNTTVQEVDKLVQEEEK